MAGKISKVIGMGSKALSSVAGSNPYIAALTTAVDIGLSVAQRRQGVQNESIDASANDFERTTVTFPAADTAVRVEHKLNRVPEGFSVDSTSDDGKVVLESSDERFMTFKSLGGSTYPSMVRVRMF